MRMRLSLGLLLLVPTIAQAQTIQQKEATPPRIAATTVTATDGTNTSLSVPLVATIGAPGSPVGGNTTDVTGSGTLALGTVNSTYVIPLTSGRSSLALRISGLTGSGAVVTVQRSNDGGTTYTSANTTEGNTAGSLSSALTVDGQPRLGVAGSTNIRLIVTTAGTGTASISYSATTAAGAVFLIGNLPSYSTPDGRVIGGVDNRYLNGTPISTGSGASDAGTQRIVISSDSSTVNRGGANLATNQISVTTAATLIAAARTGRQKITVSVGAANTCAFGNSGVTTTTGFPLQPTAGASLTLDTAAALYAVCSATTTVSYIEQY